MTREEIEAFANEHGSFWIELQSGREVEVRSDEHFGFPPPAGRMMIFHNDFDFNYYRLENIVRLKKNRREEAA